MDLREGGGLDCPVLTFDPAGAVCADLLWPRPLLQQHRTHTQGRPVDPRSLPPQPGHTPPPPRQGDVLASCDCFGSLFLWDVRGNKSLLVKDLGPHSLNTVTFDPSGKGPDREEG